jgi:protein-S-isoprenylcysteine O-methyltransferase Ste14
LYRWVRHPLYLWGLVFIWLTPQMTVNRLALVVGFSVYLYIGTFFEERRLVEEFGDDYREYQRQVPRLIPWRGPVDRYQPG